MRYRLIAIDLDGTLLGPDGRVSAANRDALRRARAAGVQIVPCTGRAWHESHAAIEGIEGFDRGIFVTGALINEIATGRTLESVSFDDALAAELVALLADLPDAVLVFRDRDQVGHDYLVTGDGELTANTTWWFEHTQARVLVERDLDAWHHCVRVAVVSRSGAGDLAAAQRRIVDRMGDRVVVHCFDGIPRRGEFEAVEILEVFPGGVDKWRGVRSVAASLGVELEAVAAIGDQINDLSMLRGAACGIAMGNAADAAVAVADRRTRPNTEDGVAFAIEQMLAGLW